MKLPVIYTIGIGNSPKHITQQAKEILADVDVVAGHFGFIELARKYLNPNAMIIDDRTARKRAATFEDYQKDRISMVVTQALSNKSVAVLSGGDSGLWGMAGVFIEAQEMFGHIFEVKVIPGVPSMTSIAARLGAPLQNGFSIISVGDEDVPFSIIEQRLKGAATGGGVIILFKLILENLAYPNFYPPEKYPELYPPGEKTKYRLQRTYDILREHIPDDRVMIIVTDAFDQTLEYSSRINLLGSESGKESIEITNFGEFVNKSDSYRFFTTVIIGDSTTKVINYKIVLTPHWNYRWTYSTEMLDKVNNLDYLISQDTFFRS
jgi:precorrin-3B C17-methyltransferase